TAGQDGARLCHCSGSHNDRLRSRLRISPRNLMWPVPERTWPIRRFPPTPSILRCEYRRIELEDPSKECVPYQCAEVEKYATSGWRMFLTANVGTVNNIATDLVALAGFTIHQGSKIVW